MKLTAMILDPNRRLIGFMVSGKAKEFGEMGNAEYERPLSTKYLMDIKFNNRQAYFSGGNITEKSGFHINQLRMLISSGDTLTEIPNTMKLTTRYVHNNENIGFDVVFGNGDTAKYKYADVMKLAELFKPDNFVVKVNDAGKQFIAGKSGCPLGALPVVEIGEASTAKKTKSAAKPVTPVTGTMVNYTDIFDVFEFVNSHSGFIINFAGTKYEATGDKIETTPSAFKPLGVGEVASPYLDFNETKFNASCKFKNPGVIEIGTPNPGPVFAGHVNNQVYTYVYRSKNIFYNGEHRLTKLGIIIPENAVEELYNRFSRSMAITEVTDETVIAVVNRLINWPNSKVFEVDTSKLALISPEKYNKFILDDAGIYRETLKLAKAKIAMKYVRGALKELAGFGYVTAPKNRPIAPQFAMKSEEELRALIMAGVDIYTGSYSESGETTYRSSGDGPAIPEVSYIIDGLDPKNYDYKKLTTTDKCPEVIAVMIDKVNAETDMVAKSKLLNAMSVELTKNESDAKKALWLHKTSMWLKANKLGVHKHNPQNWELNTKKRTKAICYNCNTPEAKGLQLLVLNTDIAK